MNTKNIDLKYKIMDEMGSYSMMETILINEDMTIIDVENLLRDTYKKEIVLMSYSENSSVNH